MCAVNKLLALSVCLSFVVVLVVVNAQYYSPEISSRRRCVLPEHPKFGQWVVRGGNFFLPGDLVARGAYLTIYCTNGYLLHGVRNIRCIRNGEWSTVLGKCLKININRLQGGSTGEKYMFSYSNVTTVVPDFSNKPAYIPSPGNNMVQGTYPWQVALYKLRPKELICSGSLISHRLIVSAAHCVTDPEGEIMPKDLYEIAVGKTYLKYDDARDHSQTQFTSIENMFTPENYQGEVQNFMGDIVLIVTTKYITFSPKIQPISLNLSSKFEKNLFDVEKTPQGFVAGWGYTRKNFAPLDDVKRVNVLPVDLVACRSYFSRDYQIYLTFDKMCAKYFDKDMAVCGGNNGGGFVVEQEGRYYLSGVVSLIAQEPAVIGDCYSQEVVLVTRVAEYSDFIQKQINLYGYRSMEIHPR